MEGGGGAGDWRLETSICKHYRTVRQLHTRGRCRAAAQPPPASDFRLESLGMLHRAAAHQASSYQHLNCTLRWSNTFLLLEVQHFDHIFMSHFFKMECLIAGASRRHQGIRAGARVGVQ